MMTSQTFQLTMQSGPTPGKVFALSKTEIVIGRDVNADVVINSAEVSRRHTRLRLEAGQYIIEDLGSTNGTFVNGQRISTPQILRPGNIIMLGEAAALVYEAAQFDPNATVISAVGEQIPFAPARPPMQASRAPQQITPPPVYTGQVPSGPLAQPTPAYQAPPPKARRENSTWLWAGAGCVLVMLCFMVVGALIFDMLNLYCTPPFDALFSFLYTCP